MPGVYVEETSVRSKSIEGVSTNTTAFVGPTLFGPVGETPQLLTSFGDFKRLYGGLNPVGGPGGAIPYLAHSALAYFDEGGSRLYVSRAFPIAGPVLHPDPLASPPSPGNPKVATVVVRSSTLKTARAVGIFQARFPGKSLEGTVSVTPHAKPSTAAAAILAPEGTLFRVTTQKRVGAKIKASSKYFIRQRSHFKGAQASDLFPTSDTGNTVEILTLNVEMSDAAGETLGTYADLAYHPSHPRFLGTVLARNLDTRTEQLSTPYAFVPKRGVSPFQLRQAFGDEPRTFALTGAEEPAITKADYEAALACIEGLSDVSIVAAPGYTEVDPSIASALIAHCEKPTAYRFAVLDIPRGQSPAEARQTKSILDSKHAALYYPWVVTAHPLFDPNAPSSIAEVLIPPSGLMCGIYARTDAERGVHKAPANEVIRSALRFERSITTAEQETLNPLGINCLRFFAGRGYRVWGARTISSDPEWKYLNLRRYFNYLESSMSRGTQWAVFEPNGPELWSKIRNTLSAFLLNEWQAGTLLGDKPEKAFFVQCDRSTMTQNDLDNGRVISVIGVAALKPAEFILFRIGQQTADAHG